MWAFIKSLKSEFVILVGVNLILYVGLNTADYHEAKLQNQIYCDNVAAGVWPDYKKSFNLICKNNIDK